jgi:hypothetical protein
VDPPTSKISSILSLESPESFKHYSQGLIVFLRNSPTKASNLALVTYKLQCFGPDASAVRYGRFISVELVAESSHLAFSAASLTL